MGTVWLAEHLVLGTDVAVKFLARALALAPGACSRFVREGRLTAKIDHPNVVRLLDCRFDEADLPYLVLELLRGENLAQRVRRLGPLSFLDARALVAQACAALEASHDAGIVHRDIKPDNVFLVAAPQLFVKLIDFGIAKPKDAAEWMDHDRLPAGTPYYMSPEHILSPDDTDERSDLFSLGAVAYFALTGRTPFEAESMEGLCVAVGQGAFVRPTRVRPELPSSVDRWFERALAWEPGDRFEGPRAMASALT